MRVPLRPAPSVEEATSKIKQIDNNNKQKKKPPPRPPPPKFSSNVRKTQSAWNINNETTLIEWSPPNSPTGKNHHTFGGSISSSFSSSTSSLASSKKSLEYETPMISNPWNGTAQYPFPNLSLQAKSLVEQQQKELQPIKKSVPTIIRAATTNKRSNNTKFVDTNVNDVSPGSESPPMPSIPPPQPPKDIDEDVITPFAIALYNFEGTHPDDLSLQVNDIVYLIRNVSEEWLYGRVGDRMGMFPKNFVDIQVPLQDDINTVTALYEFQPIQPNDLRLIPGQMYKVLRKINNDWLFGVDINSNQSGQFPANYVDKQYFPNL